MKLKPIKELKTAHAILKLKDGREVIFVYTCDNRVGVQEESLTPVFEVYPNDIERIDCVTDYEIIR